MPYGVEQNLIILAVLSNVFTTVKVQIGMPVYMPAVVPQPVYAVPAPVPIVVAIQPPPRETRATTTTTTTTPEPHYAVALPVPVPMPMAVQFAVPAQPVPVSCQAQPRQKACPPCPPCVCQPSCTPAFFSYCSPCHQKCRCRNSADAPVPLPPNPVPVHRPVYPVPIISAPVGPPPVVVVPLPPIIRRPDTTSSDSDSNDSCDSDSDGYYLRGRKKSRKSIKIRKRKYRRDAGDGNERNTDLVKPVLSYVSENGDVKFKTKLSSKDAMELLSEGKIKTSDEKSMNAESDDDLVVLTKGKRTSGRRYNKIKLRDSPTNHELKKGKNKFVFKPSSNKKINGVAVSFQVT